jgi:predicted transcriptional regulator
MSDTITVRIPRDLQVQLAKVSRSENLSISGLVRESIRRYIAVRRFHNLRKRVLPFAEAQGLLTDEDVFRQLS